MNSALLISLASFALGQSTNTQEVTDPNSAGDLAYPTPYYSLPSEDPVWNTMYSLVLLAAVVFISIPGKALQRLQMCTVVFLGSYFTLTHLMLSNINVQWYLDLSMIAISGIAAFMSYIRIFRDVCLALICAYGASYLTILITRVSYVYMWTAWMLLFAFFAVFLLLGHRNNSRLLKSISRAEVYSISVCVLMSIWSSLNMFEGWHGVSSSDNAVLGVFVGGSAFVIIFAVIFIESYLLRFRDNDDDQDDEGQQQQESKE
ncbi:hypothetical protein CWI42_060580 [Ordospora colligata]|uniref:Uncharacterized protein n=1 Tax=Ordospora colligata OC4 TaxID=1354746 RepID=A0A0B2UJX7_9MICR|nr:uncharacterized protein M896_060580 [Ordospora colligata OC4]KHN69559.1 hypothetical protein M896_060580 [Ordospora colligata OC4]TBU15379.1 hypothetical protein CWI41_060570 [Ordospora colligata]TBU15479.1 hypothetical protein CWI40_060570 [Ordospora colligata]TBU18575.1 hypothetical protein CWI42_060580 [Ordospora colligata]